MTQGNDWIISIQDGLYMKLKQSASSSRFKHSECITRAPQEMSLSPKLFTPCLISLGPVHRSSRELQAMEEMKMMYLDSFLIRGQASLEELIATVRRIEKKLRSQYDEVLLRDVPRNEFVTMMLIDGIFLIEFLLRLHFKEREEIDRMSQKRWTLLIRDILLFENQLPFLLLKELFATARIKTGIPAISIVDLIHNFLVESELWSGEEQQMKEMLHKFATKNHHILGLGAMCVEVPNTPASNSVPLNFQFSPTVWRLHRAGVKFRKSAGVDCQIKFTNGILEIPRLTIDENTEKLFVNLLAYEISNGKVHNVSDYIAMMDILIDVPKDIEVLVRHGIIKNFFERNKTAADLINKLGRNIARSGNFSYSGVVEDLSRYCRRRPAKFRTKCFNWMTDLQQNYMGSLWKSLSVIAAVILLALTVVQAVCSVLQVVWM